jgi:GNAT superfamily N-acetyltransferase
VYYRDEQRLSHPVAGLKDLPHLPEIERPANTLFAEYGLADTLASILTPAAALREAQQLDRLWVAVDRRDRPIEFAVAGAVGDNAHLDELDVHPAHGRRGVGKALVESVCEWARQLRQPQDPQTGERIP